jgi:hypothetical protein
MKARFTVLISSLFLQVSALAATQKIEIESYSYPSSASTHLDITQSNLAIEATRVCGGREQVESLDDIQITIRSHLRPSTPVAVIAEGENINLDFWYPVIKTRATVECRVKK